MSVDWVTRRYRVPEIEKKELNSLIKEWVRQQGFSILPTPKFDLRQMLFYKGYGIAPSKMALFKKLVIDMNVLYKESTLYVFCTQYFPTQLNPIFDEVFSKYASKHGGHYIEETPVAFSSSYYATSLYNHLMSLQIDYSIDVEFINDLERLEAAAEEVHVPAGVTVSIKRSRSIKRNVEIQTQQVEGEKLEVGLKFGQIDIIRATIHNEIRRQTSQSLEKTETIEYEVTLDGSKSTKYNLVWADLIRHGSVLVKQEGLEFKFPFSVRERTELHVVAS